jgi:hypothetical protein
MNEDFNLRQAESSSYIYLLNLILMISSYSNLIIYSSFLGFILLKIRFRLFLGLGTVLTIFLIFFFLKAVLNTLFFVFERNKTDEGKITEDGIKMLFKILSSVANRLKWFMLYYLIIQVNTIIIKLRSESPEISQQKSE